MILSPLAQAIKTKLQSTHPQDLSQNFADYACVAILLRGQSPLSLEIGYIIRATNPQDRWSGQVAFPGGRRESSDSNDIATAAREAFEEIGVPLSEALLLGKLNDVQARRRDQMLDFYIRPFVFWAPENFPLVLDPNEVSDFFWQSVESLKDPRNQTQNEIEIDTAKVKLPAVKMNKGPVLWGLTYLITQDLLSTLP